MGASQWWPAVELPLNERTGSQVNLLSRLFGGSRDDRAPVRPLWNRVVELARARDWYADCGVTDSMQGRFDMLAMVLAAVMLRMEREEKLIAPSALLSELFIADMDGQLRQSGVGDLVVGKRMGKLMGALGGRIAALREALAERAGSSDDGRSAGVLAEWSQP